MTKKILVRAISVIAFVLFAPVFVQARADFHVDPIYPKEQLNQTLPYFNLYKKDNVKRVGIKIINDNDHDSNFNIKVATPETNLQGVPFFKKQAEHPLINFPKEVHVRANDSRIVEGEVNYEALEDGVAVNGIVVSQDGQVENGETDSITIPFVLRGDHIPMLRISVGKIYTSYDETLGTTFIHVPIQNDVANYERKVRMEAVVKQNGKDKVRHTNTNITILPNHEDEISFPVDLADGEYQVELSIIGQDFSQSYSNDISVRIPKERRYISGGKPSKSKSKDHVEIGVLGFILICSVITVFYLINSSSKEIDEESQDEDSNNLEKDS